MAKIYWWEKEGNNPQYMKQFEAPWLSEKINDKLNELYNDPNVRLIELEKKDDPRLSEIKQTLLAEVSE